MHAHQEREPIYLLLLTRHTASCYHPEPNPRNRRQTILASEENPLETDRSRGSDDEDTTLRVRIEGGQSCFEEIKAAFDIDRPALSSDQLVKPQPEYKRI